MQSTSAKSQWARSSWLERLARTGYIARGIIYILIGVMAVLAAIGQGGQTEGTRGTLLTVLHQPGGWILVAVLAVALAGYSAWRFCQGATDADHHGHDAKGLAIRGGMFISGLTHAALAVWAAAIAFGFARGGGEGQGTQEVGVSWLMSQPFGRWLVGIVGAIVIGVGIAQILKGHKDKFERYLHWDAQTRQKLNPICTFGLYARGVVFVIIGCFIVYAGFTTNPQEAGGLADALAWLRSQPYGPWLMGGVALGLAAFGVFSIVEGIYRRIDMPA
jgi:hypothetical protein